jgi:hypothetical protein
MIYSTTRGERSKFTSFPVTGASPGREIPASRRTPGRIEFQEPGVFSELPGATALSRPAAAIAGRHAAIAENGVGGGERTHARMRAESF